MTPWQLLNYCCDVIGVEHCKIVSDYEVYPPDYYIQIPCGTCYHCLQNKRRYWVLRLLVEIEQHKENTFVTLTFDDENLAKFKGDYKRPLKLYVDRLRKALGYRPRYWFISELGDEEKFTGRFHIHGIFFGTSKEKLSYALQRIKWTYGISYFGRVQFKTAYYLTKYLLKQQPKDDYKPFIMCSHGIGLAYVNKDRFEKLVNGLDFQSWLEFHGRKFPISPYYKSKFMSDELSLIRMINNSKIVKRDWNFRNIEYLDELSYLKANYAYYQQTLNDGLSEKPKERKHVNHQIGVKSKTEFDFDYLKQLTLYG